MPNYKILSEEALEQLICSDCNKYVSFGTPRIGGEKIICQRCDQKDGVLPFFNKTVATYLFPCINRFDSCDELICYTMVEEHEKKCKFVAIHECSECDYRGNGCQLYHHFLKKHPDNFLEYPEFSVDLLEKKNWNYLYRVGNHLFFIAYQILPHRRVLKLSMNCIGRNKETTKCQIILKSLTSNKEYFRSSEENFLEEKIDILEHLEKNKENVVACLLKVKRGAELFTYRSNKPERQVKQIVKALNKNLFPKLLCPCGSFVLPPILKCPSNHVQCESCATSYCPLCSDVVNWSRAPDLEAFHDIIPLPCRWQCETLLLHPELRSHEKTCSKRLYKCIEKWCSWSGSLNELMRHWHSSEPVYDRAHQVYGFSEGLVEFYLVYNNELFYLRMDPLKNSGRNFHVRKVSNVETRNEAYAASVVLRHNCDGVAMEKNAVLKFGGITRLGKSYFSHFGECKNYKIIFNLQLT
ncbi:uncharacterized protein LOC100141808 [Tribolium castaneum]|uniref:uncharacterized protein LOC100141808 n=1 Tax=Tribolium castaneum TaxID=7070 RepID=UPI0030FE85C8